MAFKPLRIVSSSLKTATLFLHHDTDSVTVDNWKHLCRFSPWEVITVSATEKRLPGGCSILDWPEEASSLASHISAFPSLRARSTDLLMLAWFRNRETDADRYFVAEWDTRVNCCLERWLAPVRDSHFAAPSTRFPNREPEWFWFRHIADLPASMRPFACGVVPFTCLYVSKDLLSRVSESYPAKISFANGELRFASAAASCGATPVVNPNAGRTITWSNLHPVGLANEIYHPIKQTVPEPSPWMTSQESAALAEMLKPTFHVLEYGSGASTFWLSKRVQRISTVEHSCEWLNKVLPFPGNVDVIHRPPAWPCHGFGPAEPGQFNDYVAAPAHLEPDLVLVDGRARVDCARLWAGRATTILHDANRERYAELELRPIVDSLAYVLPG